MSGYSKIYFICESLGNGGIPELSLQIGRDKVIDNGLNLNILIADYRLLETLMF